mmetsp:Transcript_83906/g.179842  ORF Transcript_83906/g.179842 Transcript_83906/m.179842 type:complete len:436 (+) Transcript_83906:1252-2559(+)
MASAWEIEAHDTGVRRQERGVNGEVRRAARIRLHIDAPLLLVKAEGLQGAILAKVLDLINDFVAAVVASAGLTLGVLVGECRPEAFHYGPGSEVFRGDELDGAHLSRLLLLHEGAHGGVRLTEGLVAGQHWTGGGARGDALRGDHELGIGVAADTEGRSLLFSDELEALQHAHDDLLEVQRVEVQPGGSTLQASLAHGDASLNAPSLEGVVVLVSSLSCLHHAGWHARLAKPRHPFQTSASVEAHDAWDDRHIDAVRPAILHELQIDTCIQEHLRYHELGTCVNLLLEVVHLLLPVAIAANLDDFLASGVLANATALLFGLGERLKASLDDLDIVGVALRVASHGDGEVVAVFFAHVLHEVQGATETALGGFPLLRATRGVPSQRNDVAHTDSPALLQSLSAHLLLLVRACEVHVCNCAELVLRSRGKLQSELRS